MTEDPVQRRLAAILAADVAGYSRLMGVDEEGTLRDLKAHRKDLIDPMIAGYRGRIVKTTGDGLLVEFTSVMDAVRCAVDVQNGMTERNAALPAERRIEFRMGINVGDVLIDGTDIYGDGVNVAARLEALAEPGGICVSGAVRDHVLDKLSLAFSDFGDQIVKNIARPVHVYRVDIKGAAIPEVAESPKLTLTLPDKPSIAVLPFQNMSGDPEQEYFADGIVEDVITMLSRLPWLLVIARNSSFTFKGKAVDIKQVAGALGVRYILEGSVRKAGGRVRITGQLIDASSGAHIWADHFDGTLDDIFTLQDQVTASVVGAIEPKLRTAEMERAWRKPTGSLDAYDLYLRALALSCYKRDENRHALQLLRKAVGLDPRYAKAYGLAGLCIFWQKAFGWISPADPAIDEGIRMARLAAEEARNEPEALWMAGGVLALLGGDLRGGLALLERSLSLNPSSANACTYSSLVLAYLGESERTIALAERSMRLSPHDPLAHHNMLSLGWAHFMVGRYEDAAPWCDKALQLRPDFPPALRMKAAIFGLLGRLTEAHQAVVRLLELSPGETLAGLRTYYEVPMKKPGCLDAFLEGLRQAGLPE
jgi:adenylate cyclase